MSGQPLWMQKYKVRRAKKRGRLLRVIRCKMNLHNPPWNEAFEEYGSIMIGGACTNCDDEFLRDVTWIGDVWDFRLGIVQDGSTTTITVHNESMLEAINAHMKTLLR